MTFSSGPTTDRQIGTVLRMLVDFGCASCATFHTTTFIVAAVALVSSATGIGRAQTPGAPQIPVTVRVKDLMTPEEQKAVGLDKLSAGELAALDAWFAKTAGLLLAMKGSGPPDSPFPAHDASSAASVANLEGALISADDGQFLGKITANAFDSQSLVNEFGNSGSSSSSTSIFNEFGKYGGTFSALSPFNDLASRPPRIFKGDVFIAYLTTNVAKTPRVDPRALVAWLKSRE